MFAVKSQQYVRHVRPSSSKDIFRLFRFLFKSENKPIAIMETTQVGFFDESGIHKGARILALAGWIAPMDAWDRFSPSWDRALRKAGVESGVFHFTDLDNSEKDFKGWSQWRKANLLKELFRILKRLDPFGVCAAIIMPDYKEIVSGSGTVLEQKHSPYVICQQFCIESICARIPEKVFYIHGEQQEFDSPARKNFWDIKDNFPAWAEKMDEIVFRSNKNFNPLQAADLLAYESAKSLYNRFYDPTRPVRKSMRALLKSINTEKLEGRFFDKNGIKVLLEWNKVATEESF